MIDLSHMGCQNVKSLACSTCKIASCGYDYFKTPVSFEDALKKKLNADYLTADREQDMYFLKRWEDGSCIYFDRNFRSCSLPTQQRPTSCLVYPVRLRRECDDIRMLLNIKCPSAYAMADALIADDPSVIKYIATAALLFEEDSSYADYVMSKTIEFKVMLDVGSYYDWVERSIV